MESKVRYLDIDQVLPHVGEFGLFQILLEGILSISYVPATYQILIVYFTAYNPAWQCVKRGNSSCKLNGTFTSSSKDYEKRCNMPRSDWEYTQPKDYSIVTQV